MPIELILTMQQGMGGDIGGSVRSPGANCGIYALKPTPGRLSRAGASAFVKGQEG